jgi:hypothetical protein
MTSTQPKQPTGGKPQPLDPDKDTSGGKPQPLDEPKS